MSVKSLLSPPLSVSDRTTLYLRYLNPYHPILPPLIHREHNLRLRRTLVTFSTTTAAGPPNLTVCLAGEFSKQNHSRGRPELLRTIAASAIIFLGFGIRTCSLAATPPPFPPADVFSTVVQEQQTIQDNDGVVKSEEMEKFDDEELRASFESSKRKTYALTVPLRIVGLRSSIPPLWIKNFIKSQGKRAKLRLEFRGHLEDIFSELSVANNKGSATSKSAAAADIVTLGDTWLSLAINRALIDPIQGVEDQDWFNGLSSKWKVYLRRNSEGKLDSEGRVWAAPYRWGSMVIAYKKSQFKKHNLAPMEDWADLWRPELLGRISMIDSPREVVGAVLKCLGASYNTNNIEDQVSGGKSAVHYKLALLQKQVRLFDSVQYLKAFGVGDVWVAVGWSSDVLPAAKRMSDVAVIVPKSGASLWADLWAIPTASRCVTDQTGGRVRGPSPLVHQWIDFCLQPKRALPFEQEVIPGASPFALKSNSACCNEKPKTLSGMKEKRPKLDTNLIAGVPPPEILARCEFLEPLSDAALSDYQLLIANMRKPSHGLFQRVQQCVLFVLSSFRSQLQTKVARE